MKVHLLLLSTNFAVISQCCTNCIFSVLSVFIHSEIINKVKDPPPLCRPVISVDEAPLDVIQIIRQAWSEEPDKRPTFEEIFKQVKTHFDPHLLVLIR